MEPQAPKRDAEGRTETEVIPNSHALYIYNIRTNKRIGTARVLHLNCASLVSMAIA